MLRFLACTEVGFSNWPKLLEVGEEMRCSHFSSRSTGNYLGNSPYDDRQTSF